MTFEVTHRTINPKYADFSDTLHLAPPRDAYKLERASYHFDLLESLREGPQKGEVRLTLYDREEEVVLGDYDELAIRWNDYCCGTVEGEEE